jgi:hypothetical protein
MEEHENNPGFVIPKSFLLQLSEYTRGYMLLVCNDKGELYAHEAYDNPVIKLGLANFAEMHVNAVQKHMHNIALQEEERLDSGGAGEADDSEEGSSDF